MQRFETEKIISGLMAFTLSAVTIVVFTQSVTDPVNVTKLFVLGVLGFATFGVALRNLNSRSIQLNRIPLVPVVAFFIFSISTLIASKAPFVQSLYGVYGRNNGFLLYLLLVLLYISTLTITNQRMFRKFLVALSIAGIANVIYALWVMSFGDFIGWSNPYGNLLGTLGNPNFIGSFFGMFSALLFTVLLAKDESKYYRVGAIILLPLVFVGIVGSHAVQGKVLFICGAAIAFFFWIREHFRSKLASLSYLALATLGFLIALFGTLQKGPLAGLLYKETVSLRGEYWHAGWMTGLANPIFGAGFDSYGDWYRRSRRESALTLPGIDTISNTAHNVYLDIFAFGGWPLLFSYIMIGALVVTSIIKFTIRNTKFDSVFVGLTSVWACYQLQSTISINQIGLAVWGWAFGAAIIAYEINDSLGSEKTKTESSGISARERNRKRAQASVVSPGLSAGIAAMVGILIVAPPLSADMKWRSAQTSRDARQIEALLTPDYFNPINTFEFNNIVGLFETNNFSDLAHKYGLLAVRFNPDSFEAWRNLSQLSKSSKSERIEAFANMKRLDPLNPMFGSAK